MYEPTSQLWVFTALGEGATTTLDSGVLKRTVTSRSCGYEAFGQKEMLTQSRHLVNHHILHMTR